MQYSIWIIPPEPLYTELKDTIGSLAKKYHGPLFEPHMTLLGNIDSDLSEITKCTQELAKDTQPFRVTLGPVSFSTTYFQSVFFRVNSTAMLMDLNMRAKQLFDMENTVFMPHISLLYGEHAMETREKAVADVSINTQSVVVDRFVITPATNNPSDWEHSATIPFFTRE